MVTVLSSPEPRYETSIEAPPTLTVRHDTPDQSVDLEIEAPL